MLFILQMHREAPSTAPLGPPLTQGNPPPPALPWRRPPQGTQHSQSLGSFSKPIMYLTKTLKVRSLALN